MEIIVNRNIGNNLKECLVKNTDSRDVAKVSVNTAVRPDIVRRLRISQYKVLSNNTHVVKGLIEAALENAEKRRIELEKERKIMEKNLEAINKLLK